MTSDLTRIAAALDKAAATIDARVAPTVKKGATDIAETARESVLDGDQYDASAREFAYRNLGFDPPAKTALAIEVGYSRNMQRELAEGLEFGGANAAPGDHLGQALRRELPDFGRILTIIGARLWR